MAGPWGDPWRDPFQEFEEMWNRMSRLFEQTVAGRAEEGPWMPVAEVDEKDDAYLVRVELPGFRREDVNVEIDEQGLSVTGRRSEEGEGEGEALSRRSGRFAYHASLPRDVNTEKAEAAMRDGVLTIRLPRTGSTGRSIEITGS